LLFGSPVPGYQAPGEQTIVPGTRVVYRLVRNFDAAHRAGALAAPAGPAVAVPETLSRDLAGIRSELGLEVPEELVTRGVLIWTSLFGAVSFEVFGQYGANTFEAREELFAHQLGLLAGIIGLV
jgi:hypothetical protein